MQMTRIHRRASTAVMSLLLVAMVAAFALPAAAAQAEVIVLPGATSAEGIANGGGTTFYAGDLFAGDIFRGDVQRGTARIVHRRSRGPHGRGNGRRHPATTCCSWPVSFTGRAMSTTPVTGATVATYQFGAADTSLINDVGLTKDGAWFTNSFQPVLYFVPVDAGRGSGILFLRCS